MNHNCCEDFKHLIGFDVNWSKDWENETEEFYIKKSGMHLPKFYDSVIKFCPWCGVELGENNEG